MVKNKLRYNNFLSNYTKKSQNTIKFIKIFNMGKMLHTFSLKFLGKSAQENWSWLIVFGKWKLTLEKYFLKHPPIDTL